MNPSNLTDALQYFNFLKYQQNLMNLSALLQFQNQVRVEHRDTMRGSENCKIMNITGQTNASNNKLQEQEENLIKIEKNEISKASTTSDNGRKFYYCSYPGCNKKFTANYNRKIHYRLHTGERPFACKLCDRTYYDRANYKYHVRTAHKAVPDKEKCCTHVNCIQNFKSKKQKLVHHEKLEPECHREKNLLLNLLIKYKDTLKDILEKKLISRNELAQIAEYKRLCEKFESASDYVVDLESFYSMMGKMEEI